MDHIIFATGSIVIGLILGGIVNWLADALPGEFALTTPIYPDGAPRPRAAWLGLGAWGNNRISPDGARLSLRHPLVELWLMAIYAYVALTYPITLRSVFWMGNIAILTLITVIDLEERLILFVVIIPAWIFALIGSALTGQVAFQDYLIGGVGGFIFFFVMYLGGILFSAIVAGSRGEALDEVAFGYGDVMLATLAGFLLGWQALIFAVFITVFAGAAGAIGFLVIRLLVRGKYELFTALPYGQYIVFGTLIMMLWREPIRSFMQQGL
jgi:leader peptidase (prepilin peptidase)/N-methyltransferase